jgi:hypothetical protein
MLSTTAPGNPVYQTPPEDLVEVGTAADPAPVLSACSTWSAAKLAGSSRQQAAGSS